MFIGSNTPYFDLLGTILGTMIIFISLIMFEQRVITGGKETTVILYSDEKVAFHNFIRVISILKHLGHKQLYIATDKQLQEILHPTIEYKKTIVGAKP
ncbi:hypothetical protein [Sulfuricurvum sp.]|uniref:hypothetical protein n=1 Tax=Sulfuricurvum sp. TaxID=2025608 RepID=UPI0025EB3073|nr:hypothetical protein [Sulfuricurvum sp.]